MHNQHRIDPENMQPADEQGGYTPCNRQKALHTHGDTALQTQNTCKDESYHKQRATLLHDLTKTNPGHPLKPCTLSSNQVRIFYRLLRAQNKTQGGWKSSVQLREKA